MNVSDEGDDNCAEYSYTGKKKRTRGKCGKRETSQNQELHGHSKGMYYITLTPHQEKGYGLIAGIAGPKYIYVIGFAKHDKSTELLPAERCGKIRLGDRLVSLNNIPLQGVNAKEIKSKFDQMTKYHETVVFGLKEEAGNRKVIERHLPQPTFEIINPSDSTVRLADSSITQPQSISTSHDIEIELDNPDEIDLMKMILSRVILN